LNENERVRSALFNKHDSAKARIENKLVAINVETPDPLVNVKGPTQEHVRCPSESIKRQQE
jgi:hypothetical protein